MVSVVPEIEIQYAILELMKDRRIWTNEELRKKLRHALPWTEEDLKTSKSRGGWKWEIRVNNAISPSPKRTASLYAKGYVANAGRGSHRITDLGYDLITGVLEEELFARLRRGLDNDSEAG